MKNILALIGLAVVLVGGLGWYLGWYQLGTEPAASGHRKINVDVNTNKITDDLKKGTQRVGDLITPDGKGTQTPEKKVEGQPTGLHINPDGSATFTLPKIEIKTGN